MEIREFLKSKTSVPAAFIVIVAVFCFIQCTSGSSSSDNPPPRTGSTLDEVTFPMEIVNKALRAGEPSTSSNHIQFPPGFQVELLEGFSINSTATLQNITIFRTDGNTTPDPTVEFTLRVAAGDDPGACTGGTQAFRVGVTGNDDFSSTDVSVDDSTMSQNAFGIMSSRDFTLCTSVTSSVDANLSITGISMSFSVDQSCNPPQNMQGTWMGTFYCVDECNGITTTTPVQPIELTIYQADGAAIYIDDGDAQYFGNVCGTSFNHSGFGSGYYEWGTFTITGSNTAEKVSTWVSYDDPSCGGTCYDTFYSRSAL